MKADILREKFLQFFKAKKHKIAESDSLVPKDDPTVLFTPAGMNQFKREFLGFDSGFKRAATSQRCLRTGDLEKVGKTPAHHTFFEMLGNFSFGDYFKEEAITWAWEFLADELKMDRGRLWVSVYRDDEEAYKIWRDKIGVSQERIVRLGDKENFWPSEAKIKGPNGPCGPCSEIFFDRGEAAGCAKKECGPACDCGRFIEIWNLVFTQFNRKDNGALEPLPQKNIDTGMGLERLAAVMQGVYSNFETDLFKPITKEIVHGSGFRVQGPNEIIYAVADHLRAIVFSIYDGIMPSNEARGYVVRKLIRKALLHLRSLGIKEAFLYKLVPALSLSMRSAYPELESRKENIVEIILREEKSFIATLNSSQDLFRDNFLRAENKADPVLAGKAAFRLYDTYGIPFELTKDWLNRQGIEISEESFSAELNLQKSRSQSQSSMKGDVFSVKEFGPGDKETEFIGYKQYAFKAKILKIIRCGKPVDKAVKAEEVSIILDKTPFYPESGGQIGDTGNIIKGKNSFLVKDTQKSGKIILHSGIIKEGSFKPGAEVTAEIDAGRRLSIARNHTATHMLQAALRQVLGKHVKQQGSLVDEQRLRFDFTHFKDIAEGELERIEELVNNYILSASPLCAKEMAQSQAKKKGALAFFAEKYGEKVRVVSIGDFSHELCGGTHLEDSAQVGLFKVMQEGSVASGIRRIEACTGVFAYKLIKENEAVLSELCRQMNTRPERAKEELASLLSRLKQLEKQLAKQRFNLIAGSLDGIISSAESVNNIKVIAKVIEGADINLLRKAIDMIKEKTENSIIVLGSNVSGRALLVMGLTADLAQKGWDASKMIAQVASPIAGSGGGRKDFAQAGGNKPENFPAAFQELKRIASEGR